MQTFIDKYIDQGRKKGRDEGWKEGKQEGGASLLISQLKQRFGPLPDWADQKKKSDSKTLEAWGLNLLSAERLEDIFSVDHQALIPDY